jgi:hypothetical protein
MIKGTGAIPNAQIILPTEMAPIKFKITTIFFFSFIILCISASSQQWQNPAEKYKDAYKKYLNAGCPILKDSIQHFVYFSRDRESIINHPLLEHPMFKGAQIMYSWRDLEPQKGCMIFQHCGKITNTLKNMAENFLSSYRMPHSIQNIKLFLIIYLL